MTDFPFKARGGWVNYGGETRVLYYKYVMYLYIPPVPRPGGCRPFARWGPGERLDGKALLDLTTCTFICMYQVHILTYGRMRPRPTDHNKKRLQ